ncbi:MAG: hypothetical protein M4D80_38810 [Myxococcota bacterium]|nr:hypothetical protein [Myxococcota bacterium]
MRRILIALALLGSSQAVASPTWADWVGDFRGPLTWRRCTAPGEASATLRFDAVDGATRLDLAPAGAALRELSLTAEDDVWVAQDGDVQVRLARKKPSTIDVAIDYESGCTMRGRLARASTGVPACDRLLAWARIENRCTKASTKLEDHAALAKLRWKKIDAARCSDRADKIALAMIDAGCAPHPDPNIGHRAVQCRTLVDLTQKLARCGRVPPEIQQRLTHTASALSAASQSAEPATLPYVEQQCKDARAEVSGTAVQFQCQL